MFSFMSSAMFMGEIPSKENKGSADCELSFVFMQANYPFDRGDNRKDGLFCVRWTKNY